MKMLTAFTIGALLLATQGAWADAAVYKWVDKNGVTHYSTDPKDAQAAQTEQTNIVDKGNVVSSAPAPSTAPAPATAGKQAVAVDPNDSPACKAAKSTLNNYLAADYLYTLDANGQKQKLPADQQAKQISDARDQVAKACTPGS